MIMNIDGKHEEILKKFNEPSKQNSKEQLNLKRLLSTIDINDWKKRNEIMKQISDLQQKQDTYEQKNTYLLNAASILEEYTSNRKPIPRTTNEIEKLENFNDSYSLNSFVVKTSHTNKGHLFSLYNDLTNTKTKDNVSLKTNDGIDLICDNCGSNMMTIHSEAVIVCIDCGKSEPYFDCSAQGMTYEQELTSDVNTSFAYKRINHFNEWMAHFQAKDVTQIPQSVLDSIMKELKKSRIVKSNDITEKKVKEILKKLKFNKFYENSSIITNVLNGKKLKTMEPELEERLRSMFMLIQEPFEKFKPKERSNFLSYSYCLYKFCELLERDEYLCHFPLLKSREKLQAQDRIWKDICEYLKWEYIATI